MHKISFIRIYIIGLLLFPFKAETKAQESILNQKLSFALDSVSIDSTLKYIEKQIDFNFTYDANLFDKKIKLKPEFNDATLSEIIAKILSPEEIEIEIIDMQLVIYKKEVSGISSRSDNKKPIPVTKIKLKGIVLDKKTNHALSFASLNIYNKSTGTICNEEGRFVFHINHKQLSDTLLFSHLGYRSTIVKVSDLLKDSTVYLQEKTIPLQEVIIRSSDPRSIVENATSKIAENYSNHPHLLRAFYRESVLRNEKYLVYTEGLLDVYKSSYTNPGKTDRAKVIKKRKYTDINQHDTILFKLKGGISSSIDLDIIKNRIDFLDPHYMHLYNYRMQDIVVLNDKLHYLIHFEQRAFINEALFSGNIYIEIATLAIAKADFGYEKEAIRQIQRNFVLKSSRGVRVKPKNVSYSVSFREYNKLYYINHIRGELNLKVRKKKKILSSEFKVNFEMVNTDIDTSQNESIAYSEKVKKSYIFSEWDLKYDADFWENENFIQPEIDLNKALLRFKKGELEISK